jgi:hypothetical protein
MTQAEWVPDDVDTSTPNAARMYDYYLGGAHNFAVDRGLADKVLEQVPAARPLALAARRWLTRAVTTLTDDYGIDQFLDLGSGIPGVGSTHEVARQVNPAARVVYVDHEAVAIAHSELMTGALLGVGVVGADFTSPELVLNHEVTRNILDLSRPVALVFSCSLHLVPDERHPVDVIATYRDAVASGSYLAITHGTQDGRPDFQQIVDLYKGSASSQFVTRPRGEVERFFAGFDMIDPGLVHMTEWRPDTPYEPGEAAEDGCYAAVGRKP